ncbi:MAG: hypothetical protein ABIH50_07785 [bacterium]
MAQKFLFLFLIIISLTSCSTEKQITVKNETASEEVVSIQVTSREAVYLYNEKKITVANLVLSIHDEPLLLPAGYAKLVGVVSGGKNVACVEVGGRGIIIEEGEKIDDYRVVRIKNDRIILKR